MIIQHLKPDPHFPGQLEGEIYFPLFNKVIKVTGFRSDNLEYADECARLLTKIEDTVVQQLCSASIRYCNDFLKSIGQEPPTFDNEREVLTLIDPSFLLIEENEIRPAIHLELACDWEEEHGMEWAIRDGQVVYVGAFNGISPFDDFSPEEFWNYA